MEAGGCKEWALWNDLVVRSYLHCMHPLYFLVRYFTQYRCTGHLTLSSVSIAEIVRDADCHLSYKYKFYTHTVLYGYYKSLRDHRVMREGTAC